MHVVFWACQKSDSFGEAIGSIDSKFLPSLPSRHWDDNLTNKLFLSTKLYL